MTRIASSIVIIKCPRKMRSDLATAMNIQPIIQGGEVCMGTAITRALLTTMRDLHIGVGEDCEPTSASRIGAHTTERIDDVLAVARHGLMQVRLLKWVDTVEKVENRKTPKISQMLIFGQVRRWDAASRQGESPWSFF